MRMKRRLFIQILTTTLAALAGTASAIMSPAGPHTVAAPALAAFLGGRDGILRIGRAYRDRFPEESDPQILTRALPSDTDGNTVIEERIVRDFTLGDTVLLDGWMLSRTEARQAALYSLINS